MNFQIQSKVVFLSLIVGVIYTLGGKENLSEKRDTLFNGKNLNGWKIPNGNKDAKWYQATNGVLKIKSGPKKKGSVL